MLRLVTHPQVRVDKDVPVPRWGLSDVGRARAESMLGQLWLPAIARIVSSGETKALETAAILSASLGVAIEVREALHENDRSSTGFVPPDRFETLADAFFGEPTQSVEGWETAAAAQSRVVQATADLLDESASGDVLIVGHGAIGTLLYCHLAELPISREHDQVGGNAASGGGNYWSYNQKTRSMQHPWMPMDRVK